MLIGALLLVAGIALVLWGAERFTDGALRTAMRFSLSSFYVGAVVSGFEPENLVTGAAAAVDGLDQVALGTVIGSAVFLLTAGLGVTVLLVPMEVRIPREGPLAMVLSLLLFAGALWDGTVSRTEGVVLALTAIGLMVWLYRRSPLFQRSADKNGDPAEAEPRGSRARAIGLLIAGVAVMLVGAELMVRGVHALLGAMRLSETFLGMVVIGMGESLEETARMVVPARRGHPELAWGNVVGTVVILLALNLGLVALMHPLTADPLVIRLHAPYLAGCVLIVAGALLWARRLGRPMGVLLLALCALYLALNLAHMWQEPAMARAATVLRQDWPAGHAS
jgi:cation:H+ antiporter